MTAPDTDHAPQEPQEPKRVEVTWWATLDQEMALEDVRYRVAHGTLEGARGWAENYGYRIVRVDAVISEVDDA